jgi:N-acyl-phosphatidylethanolamine-hydrolysing phospholipase D
VGFRAILRWWRDRLLNPPPADPDPSAFEVVSSAFDDPFAPEDRLTLTWVGHSTFLIQIGGVNVLTDPIWSERSSPLPWIGPKRFVPPGIPFDHLPLIDVVLQSHDHYDHLDDLTVCRLEARNPGAMWVVPTGLGSFLRRRGVHKITELQWWEVTRWGPLTIGCTPAKHFSGRTPWGRDRTLWCGWSVAAGARRVYFAGDTGYHPEFSAIGKRFGPFEVMLLPIGAYEPRWAMETVHMNPEEAVRAFQEIQHGATADELACLVPMHWGTFKLTDEPLDEPPQRASEAWRAAGLPRERYRQLAHGETLAL